MAKKVTLEQLAKTIDQLAKNVDRGFKAAKADNENLARMVSKGFIAVDKRFEQVDIRFEQVDKRFEQVDGRFDRIEGRLTELISGSEIWNLLRPRWCAEKVGLSSRI